jgi:hypothetical protein
MKKILALFLGLVATATAVHAELITVLTSGNRLLTVDSASPGTVAKTVTITGLATGESLVGIDYRPGTGGLFALGSSSRIYAINHETGAATAVGAAGVFTLSGTRFGFDFNPTVDRIRITSDADQDLRVNPNDGTLSATDTPLAYAATDVNAGQNPNVVGSAYTNSFSTAAATVLYDIDSNRDVLVIQNPPNAGTLNTVGSLSVDTSDNVGFDISGFSGVAYASLTVSGVTNLYVINLVTGAATTPPGATAPASIAPGALGGETVVDIAANVNAGSRLLNLSSRGRVGNGDDVLIAGFVTQGGVNSRVLVRALGPTLGTAGVSGVLADPVLTIFDKNGNVVATNDGWRSTQETDITATGLAPGNNAEATILTRLAPDAYTAIVSGKGGNTGVALVEVYQLQ